MVTNTIPGCCILTAPSKPDIENFEIGERLGTGGMSSVWQARDLLMERDVAVKVLHDSSVDLTDFRRFQREAQSTSALSNNPNVIKVFALGLTRKKEPYLSMELLKGGSLADRLRQGTLSLAEVEEIFPPLLTGLQAAHDIGIIHRDIKPANIMFDSDAEGRRLPKLVDFGIARRIDAAATRLTMDGSILGSPAYMSPEQCNGQELDGRSDVYSIACVIYQSLTGVPLFDNDNALDVMYRHSNEKRPSAEKVCAQFKLPRAVVVCILRALDIDREQRYRTAAEFGSALRDGLAAAGETHRSGAIVLALLSSALLLIVAVYLTNKRINTPSSPAAPIANPATSPVPRLARLSKSAKSEVERISQSLKDNPKDTPDREQNFKRGIEIIDQIEKKVFSLSAPKNIDRELPMALLCQLAWDKGGEPAMRQAVASRLKESAYQDAFTRQHLLRRQLQVLLSNDLKDDMVAQAVLAFDKTNYRGDRYLWDLVHLLSYYAHRNDDKAVSDFLAELDRELKSASSPNEILISAACGLASYGNQYAARMGIGFVRKHQPTFTGNVNAQAYLHGLLSDLYARSGDKQAQLSELHEYKMLANLNEQHYDAYKKKLHDLEPAPK
jgi:serine/threonine protein kinase